MLYIVSTPIGNLEDITLRALRVLKEVDYIVAEDTRHCQKLLKHYDISKPLLSFHSYSGRGRISQIVELLKEGKNMALISDAGTPGISDPGFTLIRAVIDFGIALSPIPGPTACIAGLVVSGLAMNRFRFLGFLPLKKGRQTLLKSLKLGNETVIFYEAPHRLLKTLNDILTLTGDFHISVMRELTKLHEEVFRGRVSSAIKHFSSKKVRGELVLVMSVARD